jgi:hypothetical protein
MDLADRIMRRTLGLDDDSARPNTIVSLQLVNDRLQTSIQNEVLEGDFITEGEDEPPVIRLPDKNEGGKCPSPVQDLVPTE